MAADSTQAAPRSIDPGSVISTALNIYKSQAAPLLISALIVFTVEALLVLALGIVGAILTIVISTFYQGMVVQLVRDVQDGRRDSSVGDLFKSVAPVVGPLIAVSLLAGIGIAIGFVLLIVPGLFLMTIWSVVAPVMVIERPGVFRAFGRSRELVRGYGWQVFGVIIVVILILIVVGILVGIIAGSMSDAAEAVVNWAFNVVTAPFAALLVSVLYFGLKRAHGETAPPAAPAGWAPPTATPPADTPPSSTAPPTSPPPDSPPAS